jgi:hypothetical protein
MQLSRSLHGIPATSSSTPTTITNTTVVESQVATDAWNKLTIGPANRLVKSDDSGVMVRSAIAPADLVTQDSTGLVAMDQASTETLTLSLGDASINSGQLVFDTQTVDIGNNDVVNEDITVNKTGREGGSLMFTRQRTVTHTENAGGFSAITETSASGPLLELKPTEMVVPHGRVRIADATDTFEVTRENETLMQLGDINIPGSTDTRLGMKILESNYSRISNPGADGTVFGAGLNFGEVMTLDRLLNNNEVTSKFHALVVEGGLDRLENPVFVDVGGGQMLPTHSSSTFSSTFKNPITTHEKQHRVGFSTGDAAMEPLATDNSVTVNCQSTFTKD